MIFNPSLTNKMRRKNKQLSVAAVLCLFFVVLCIEKPVKIFAEKYCISEIMSKRSSGMAAEATRNKKPTKHWSLSLLDSMKDPDSLVKKTERVVVIRDKYPKAKFHYLMLPEEEINGIHKLDKRHVSLLEEFGSLYEILKDEHKDVTFRAGFHAVPSMQRLHMHVISTDMISPCLKTKVHWNSFTTKFFLPYEEVLKELKENSSINKMSSELHKSLMATPLVCNQCSFKPKNMPQLKEHLLTHK